MLISAFGGAGFYVVGAFWVLECTVLFGPDAHDIARQLTTFGFAFLLGIFFVGWAIDLSRGRIREVFLIASCVATAGVAAMNAISVDTPMLSIGLSFLAGLGLGGIYVPMEIVLTILSPDQLIGGITGLGLAFRWIGGGIGYAIYFNVVQNKLTDVVPTVVGTAVVEAGLPITKVQAFIEALLAKDSAGLAAAGATPPILQAALSALVESYTEAIQLVYLVSIAFTGAAVITSLFLKDIREHMNERVIAEIKY